MRLPRYGRMTHVGYGSGMDYRSSAGPLEPDRSVLVVGLKGRVFGIDRQTGKALWRNDLPGGGGDEVFLAIGYGAVLASAQGPMIYCLDYLTGHERWKWPTHTSGRATILIEPDHIVCAKSGYLDCFSPEGRLLWAQPLYGAGVGRISLGYPENVAQADDAGQT